MRRLPPRIQQCRQGEKKNSVSLDRTEQYMNSYDKLKTKTENRKKNANDQTRVKKIRTT